uniref:Vacuolar protein sorting-associated protein 45 n=1 Tax=Aceria tosichella TaxID=561515 RepID=A0A6G1S9L0_9ACAR
MHLIEPIRLCIDEILQSTGSGIKSMILDDFTTGVISSGYTKSEMLLREVYLFEYIDTIFESTERLNHVKCIVILRPTRENIERLCFELGRPHYRTYNIYFTNRIGSATIDRLAEADETEVVRCVREVPLDFQPITPFLFHLKIVNKTFNLKTNDWFPESLKRSTDGLVSALIALQVNPLIRYQTQSQLCKVLAEKVNNQMRNESIRNIPWRRVAPFDLNSLLVIIDRRYDLTTPMVNKWTYYPMIHELFDIKQNRINLVNVPNRQPKDPKEMLISIENDQFFDENYFKNYGELGVTLKTAVENLKNATKSHNKLETMEDMKRFIDEYPETRRYASNLQCHVFLMSELTRIVSEHNLMVVSECEQELACNTISHNETLKKLKQLIPSTTVRSIDALRLVSLYIVCRSEKSSSNINDLVKLLKSRKDLKPEEIDSIKHLREFSSSKAHNPLLDETVQQVTRMIVQNVKGVDNVLTQYKPNVSRIIDDLRKGNKLKETEFAFCGERYKEESPRRIILFFVGGATYDEALVADEYNRLSTQGTQIIVGGTSLHNFKSFIDEVCHSTSPQDSES